MDATTELPFCEQAHHRPRIPRKAPRNPPTGQYTEGDLRLHLNIEYFLDYYSFAPHLQGKSTDVILPGQPE